MVFNVNPVTKFTVKIQPNFQCYVRDGTRMLDTGMDVPRLPKYPVPDTGIDVAPVPALVHMKMVYVQSMPGISRRYPLR